MFGAALGRFSPIHLGHEQIIKAMREMCTCTNCLVIIGSSNAPMSKRDFFSYRQRRGFIKSVYADVPTLRLTGLPDYQDNEQWLLALDDLICAITGLMHWQVKEEVTFFGGSQEDLRFFIEDGRRIHVVNRFDGVSSPKISASEIRDDLRHSRSITGKVNSVIESKVITTFNANWESFSAK